MINIKKFILTASLCTTLCQLNTTTYSITNDEISDSPHYISINDEEMFKDYAGGYNTNGYLLSVDLNEQYDSDKMLESDEILTLDLNIYITNIAAFFIKNIEQVEMANKILQKYFPNEIEGYYRNEGNYFYITDLQKDELDDKKMEVTFNEIKNALIESDVIDVDKFYYPKQIYEHHELYIPYLTGYYSSKNPDSNSNSLKPEQLQEYIDKNELPCTLQSEEERSYYIYNIVPNEKLDFESHIKLALKLWNDLNIVPYAYNDNFKSDNPKIVISLDTTYSNIKGDANCDGELSMADAVIIMQSIANPAKYGIEGTNENHITEQGKINADIAGENDGITNADALAIQKKLLNLN